jgi:hypothetical protein
VFGPWRPDAVAPRQGAVPEMVGAYACGCWRHVVATSMGAQSATAAGDGFGVQQGDARGGVRPVFSMLSCWRGWLTQLCGYCV